MLYEIRKIKESNVNDTLIKKRHRDYRIGYRCAENVELMMKDEVW